MNSLRRALVDLAVTEMLKHDKPPKSVVINQLVASYTTAISIEARQLAEEILINPEYAAEINRKYKEKV